MEHDLVDILHVHTALHEGERAQAQQAAGDAARSDPQRRLPVDGLLPRMDAQAGDLGNEGVHQVGADGQDGPDPDDQNEQWRHEGGAAHTRQAHEYAHEGAEGDHLWLEVHLFLTILIDLVSNTTRPETAAGHAGSVAAQPPVAPDQRVGRAVVPQVRLAGALQLGDDPPGQDLAELDAPLV